MTSERYGHTEQDFKKLLAHGYELGKVFPMSGQPRHLKSKRGKQCVTKRDGKYTTQAN